MNETDYALLLDSAEKVTADLACNLLEEAGIPTYRHSPDFDIAELGSAAHGAVRGISVFVPPEELARARALLLEAWGEEGLPKEFMPGESET